MSDRNIKLATQPSVFENVVFDPYAHSTGFDNRRHSPSSTGTRFTRWRDFGAPELSRAEGFATDVTDRPTP